MKRLESRADDLGIGDVQLCLTSLEDVFLAIARKVGAGSGGLGAAWCSVLLWAALYSLYAHSSINPPTHPPKPAQQAELEHAAASGSTLVSVDLPSGSRLMVGLGDDAATDPADGSKWRVKWSQDDTGKLVVLGAEPWDAVSAAPSPSRPRPLSRMKSSSGGAGVVRSVSLGRLLLGRSGGDSNPASAAPSGPPSPVAVTKEPDGVSHVPSEATPGRWDIACQTSERYSSSGGFLPNQQGDERPAAAQQQGQGQGQQQGQEKPPRPRP